MIKLCDLSHQPKEVYEAAQKVLESGRYVKGPLAEEFAQKWAERCEMKYGVPVASGAVALELVVETTLPTDIWRDEITYTPWTYKAVPNAIRRMGYEAYPMAEMPELLAHHLHETDLDYIPVVEDCSHVHGYKPVAETAIFSMFPTKILGACGDAGIIVTNNRTVYEQCKDIANHGEPNGTNARMDELQAAILLAKLPYLDHWIARRKEIVEMYDKGLGRQTPGNFHYAYAIPGSEAKKQKLIDMGVESAFYYTPEFMALPLHPYLTDQEVERVIECVKTLES